MTIDEAAAILSQMYNGALPGEKVAQIHLFGIQYAQDIECFSPAAIAKRADIHASFATEINKGRKLARYVQLRG